LAVVVAGTILPAPWGLAVVPGESRNWIVLLTLALVLLLGLSRDPAATTLDPRGRRRTMRRAFG